MEDRAQISDCQKCKEYFKITPHLACMNATQDHT